MPLKFDSIAVMLLYLRKCFLKCSPFYKSVFIFTKPIRLNLFYKSTPLFLKPYSKGYIFSFLDLEKLNYSAFL